MRASNFGKSGNGREFFSTVALMVVTSVMVAGCGGGGDDATETAQAADGSRSAQAMAVKTTAASTWTKVASQDAYFHAISTTPIRYGAGSSWVKLRLAGSYQCNVATFGVDPAPGVTKTCESRDSLSPVNGMLTWVASTDAAVTGYKVYYGTAAGKYLQAAGAGLNAGKNLSFSVVNLPVGSTYYFAVTAVDASGNESAYSNEAAKLSQ